MIGIIIDLITIALTCYITLEIIERKNEYDKNVMIGKLYKAEHIVDKINDLAFDHSSLREANGSLDEINDLVSTLGSLLEEIEEEL